MHRSVIFILIISLLFISCHVKEVNFEYTEIDPENPDFIPEQPAITGSSIEQGKYPAIRIKPGTFFGNGILIEKSITEETEYAEAAIVDMKVLNFVDRSGIYSPWLQYRVSTVNKGPETDLNDNQVLKFDLGRISISAQSEMPGGVINLNNNVRIDHSVVIDFRGVSNDDEWSDPLIYPDGVWQINPSDYIPDHAGIFRIRSIADTDGVISVISEVSRVYYTSGISNVWFVTGDEGRAVFGLTKTGDHFDSHIIYVSDDAGDFVEIGRAGRNEYRITGNYNFKTGQLYRFKFVTLYKGKPGHTIQRDQIVVSLNPPVIHRVTHIDDNSIEVIASVNKDYEGEMQLRVNAGYSEHSVFSTRVSGKNMVFNVTGLPGSGSVYLSAGNEVIGFSGYYNIEFDYTFTNTGVLTLPSGPEWMALSGDRSVMALVNREGSSTRIEVYNTDAFNRTGTFALPFGSLQGVPWALNLDGSMAVVGYSSNIHLVNLQTGERSVYSPPIPEQNAGINNIRFISRDRNTILYSNGVHVFVYDPENEEELQHFTTGSTEVRNLDVDYNYEYAVMDWASVLNIYSIEDERLIHKSQITNLGFLPKFRALKSEGNSLIQRVVTSSHMFDHQGPPYNSVATDIKDGYRIDDNHHVNYYRRDLSVMKGSEMIISYRLPDHFPGNLLILNNPYQRSIYQLIRPTIHSGSILFRLRYGIQRHLNSPGYPYIMNEYYFMNQ